MRFRRMGVGVLLLASGVATAPGCHGREGTKSSPDANAPADLVRGDAGAAADAGGMPSDGGDAADVAIDRPDAVAPEISRAWSWQPCGTIVPDAVDQAAAFDSSGRIAVLNQHGVRVYDASGALQTTSNVSADFLVTVPGGATLVGTIEPSGIELAAIGATSSRYAFVPASKTTCGKKFSFSADGAYLLASGGETACAWRTSDGSFVGAVAGSQVAIRGATFVTVVEGPTTDVVTRDFQGKELSRLKLTATGSPLLSPAGDRLVVGGMLWNLDSGANLFSDVSPPLQSGNLVFSAGGDLVLAFDGVFRTADGSRLYTVDPGGRMGRYSYTWLALSPDGRRLVRPEYGRATLFDVEAKGIAAVLGPPPLPQNLSGRPINHLALSGDGSLLVSNVQNLAAFGLKLAPKFGDSKVVWDISAEINLWVDISADGQLVSIGGDGRAVYSGMDGRNLWPALPPPAGIATDICIPERLRFSPKGTWVAGSEYARVIQVFASGEANGQPWKAVTALPGCDAVAFTRDERLMATSGAALYQTAAAPDAWRKVWSISPPAPPAMDFTFDASDVVFSPDENQLVISRCHLLGACVTTLVNVETGAVLRTLPELEAAHPAFSPDGHWIVAGGTLLHLPSGDVRALDPAAAATPKAITTALFTGEGDIITGSADEVLTRYCRTPPQ